MARQKYAKGEEWKRTLEPWSRLYAQAHAQMVRHLDKMTDEQLAELRAAIDKPGQANCWWATYAVAQVLRREVDWEIGHRVKQAQRWDVVREDGAVIIAATTTTEAKKQANWLNRRARGRHEYTLTQVA